jgi:hypothetical protein
VFKTKQYQEKPVIKIAEGKTTIPGKTNVIRIIKNGKYVGDVIRNAKDEIVCDGKLNNDVKAYTMGKEGAKVVCYAKGEEAYTLLKPLMRNGKFITQVQKDLRIIQAKAKSNLQKLADCHKRLSDSKAYNVALDQSPYNLQQLLIKVHTGR